MSDDAEPDYTTMSGAEFKRAVGADPEKWAEAFIQSGHMPAFIHADMVAWFRDAMEAAVNATRHEYDDLIKTGTWTVSARAGYGNKPSD